MQEITGRFTTPHASKYIAQLCKHFSHKVSVGYDDTSGWAEMPTGRADMLAHPDQLEIRLNVTDSDLIERAKYAIDSHLVTFAFRENFEGMQWE